MQYVTTEYHPHVCFLPFLSIKQNKTHEEYFLSLFLYV